METATTEAFPMPPLAGGGESCCCDKRKKSPLAALCVASFLGNGDGGPGGMTQGARRPLKPWGWASRVGPRSPRWRTVFMRPDAWMGGRCCGWCSAYRGCEAVVTGQIHYAWLDDVWLERRQGFFSMSGALHLASRPCVNVPTPNPLPPLCAGCWWHAAQSDYLRTGIFSGHTADAHPKRPQNIPVAGHYTVRH